MPYMLTSSQICMFNAQSVLTRDSEVAFSISDPIPVVNSVPGMPMFAKKSILSVLWLLCLVAV